MSTRVRRASIVTAGLAATALFGVTLSSQTPGPPTNDAPNPYNTVENFFKMPEGRTWGSTSAVEIDKDGKTIWVAERCGTNSCGTSNLDPILHFDTSGKLLKSFGAGLIIFPHGIHVDRDGNVWVTDGQGNAAAGRGGRGRGADAAAAPATPPAPKGHQIFKFSPDGKLLMTLGKAGGGTEPEFFMQPNDVITNAAGEIFVSEGHASTPGSVARVLKFTKDGKLIKTWGKLGKGNGEFDQPHTLAFDSKGRLFVGDRGNSRIQIFDQEGTFLEVWYQFSRPSGLYIDKNDILYSADSESNAGRNHGDWVRGIRIGSVRDGKVTAFIPDPERGTNATSAAEGVAADDAGNVYGAEVGPRALKKYVKK